MIACVCSLTCLVALPSKKMCHSEESLSLLLRVTALKENVSLLRVIVTHILVASKCIIMTNLLCVTMTLQSDTFSLRECNKAGQTTDTSNHIFFVLDKHTNINEWHHSQ
jgi:hypothetical protein